MSEGDPPMEMCWDLHHSPSAKFTGSMSTAHKRVMLIHSNPESVNTGCCDAQKTKASDSSHHPDVRIRIGTLLTEIARPPNEYASVELQQVTLGV